VVALVDLVGDYRSQRAARPGYTRPDAERRRASQS
jgi:hypothetical protein